ncbi:MAG: hypothetical protein JO356_03095 [Acidobacteria bacterium]|nr:hypothetical protein [Acidobacteriota bacterium]
MSWVAQSFVILMCVVAPSPAADFLTGVVHNASRAQLAAGDQVILFDLNQHAREEARSKTNSQGTFMLALRDPGRPHLVRVIHQGINYDTRVSAGGTISIDVFDSTTKAHGISGSIEIIRAGIRGDVLHISDMLELRNESSPPVIQAGQRSFEVYLPSDAILESVLAAGPENTAASISAASVQGEPGHYTVNFPVRPGATKFAFNYDVPYNGRVKFRAKRIYPFQQLAVMVPSTMTFTGKSLGFQALSVGNIHYHVEAAENVQAGVVLEFEISGPRTLRAMPANNRPLSNPPAESAANSVLAMAAGTPLTPNTVAIVAQAQKIAGRSSRVWWALACVALIGFPVCVFLLWRWRRLERRTIVSPITPAQLAQRSVYLVDSLKDTLFQLEAGHVQGAITSDDYISAKQALEMTIRQALTRTAKRQSTGRAVQ